MSYAVGFRPWPPTACDAFRCPLRPSLRLSLGSRAFSRPTQDVARPSAPRAEFAIRTAQSEAPSRLQWFGRPRLTRPVEADRRQAGRASRWTGRASFLLGAACRVWRL